jgi:hypothetical protein
LNLAPDRPERKIIRRGTVIGEFRDSEPKTPVKKKQMATKKISGTDFKTNANTRKSSLLLGSSKDD